MQTHVRARRSLRLELGIWLLAALILLGLAAGPGVSYAMSAAGQAQDETITYVVKPGDMLRDIAARYGVSMGAIVRANGLTNPDVIYPGQKLVIPVPGTRAAPPTVAATSTPEISSPFS